MSSLTNMQFFQGILYLKTSVYPLNRELYDILIQIDTCHRNELFVQEQELLDSVLNIPIFILEVKPTLTEEEQSSLDVWNDIDNWKGLCLEAQEDIFEHIFNPDIILCFEEDKRNEEHERVMMGFEDYPAQCAEELERMVENHERVMMGFEDHPAKTVEELDREKREFFELMYQRILSNLNLFIQNFLNFSSQVDDVFDDFEEKELRYIKDNILVNLIKINLNIFDFLDRFELSNFFLFCKMILLQIKIVSYEEENIAVGKTQRGKIEMILDKKKINQEGLKHVMREIGKFISNGTLEVQGPDGGSLFQPDVIP
jgi:hypothetical protein